MPNQTHEQQRADWLEARKGSIGGSDAACACNYSRWKDQLSLWAEWMDIVEPADLSGNESVQWGKRLEPVIADAYTAETGRELVDPGEFAITRRADCPRRHATLDRIIYHWPVGKTIEHVNNGVLQIKTAGAHFAGEWAEHAPLQHQIQLQHEMWVADVAWGSLVCLIGGQRLVWRDYDRDDNFIHNWLLPRQNEFLRRVDENDPPPAGSEAKDVLAAMHPKDDGEAIPLDWEAAELDTFITRAQCEAALTADGIEAAKNRIKQLIGDATYGVLPDGSGRWSWKADKRGNRRLTRSKGNGSTDD